MKSRINITYHFDGEMTVSSKAELTLENGEIVEFALPSGSISSEKRLLVSKMNHFYSLSFMGKKIDIGFCPTGNVTGYEKHIFDAVQKLVKEWAKGILANQGNKPKFENVGSNLILATY